MQRNIQYHYINFTRTMLKIYNSSYKYNNVINVLVLLIPLY